MQQTCDRLFLQQTHVRLFLQQTRVRLFLQQTYNKFTTDFGIDLRQTRDRLVTDS